MICMMLSGRKIGKLFRLFAIKAAIVSGLVVCSEIFSASAAQADTVLWLAGGGKVVGEVLNPDEVPRQKYVIRTPDGIELIIPRRLVSEVATRRPEEVEYEHIRSRFPDTVEGHWQLAEWCKEHNLVRQREKHLRRIIELDPDHKEARRLLGYMWDGQNWTTREERMTKDGFVFYKGKWMLPQEVRLLEQEEKIKQAEGEWKKKVLLWQKWLGGPQSAEAKQNITSINDPFAVPALLEALKREPRAWVRLMLIKVLARIGTAPAMEALLTAAMQDPVEEVRRTAVELLKEKAGPSVSSVFVRQLRSSNNVEINRAAEALRQLGDKSAIAPLIDVLVTTHKEVIVDRPSGQMSVGFGSSGPTGFSMGQRKRVVTHHVQNRAVLDALVELTGVNFGFHVARWRAWYAAQKSSQVVSLRRD